MPMSTLITEARTAAAHLAAVERYVETADELPENILPLLDAHAQFTEAASAVREELLRGRATDGPLQRTLTDAITAASLGAGQLGGATLLAASGHSDDLRARARTVVTHPAVLASELVRRADDALALVAQQWDAPQRSDAAAWHGSVQSLDAASSAYTDAAVGWRTLRSVADVDVLATHLQRATGSLSDGMQFATRHRAPAVVAGLARAWTGTNYARGFVSSYANIARDAPDAVRAELLRELRSFSGFYEEKARDYAERVAAATRP